MDSLSEFTSGTERFVRFHLRGMHPYQPIMPPVELSKRHGIAAGDIIKLDGNENPYGCSPRVSRALASHPHYHIYPDPEQRELREALSGYVGVDADHIVAGSGSDELIDLILRLFLEPGDEMINCPPTFGMYPFSTQICGGKMIEVSRDENFAINVTEVKQVLNQHTKVLFLASPNNPSGNLTPRRDILELLNIGIIVVVDEAYYEFSGETVANLVPNYDNLIALRTFSKWAGLAGLRIGYGIFPHTIAQYLLRIKPPYNVNAAAEVAARESLADLDYLRGTIRAINRERGRLLRKLRRISFLKPFPSKANFILCRVLDGRARNIYQDLQKAGIFIRHFDTPLLRNYLRISVGKPEHTDALIEALAKIAKSRG
jgi:histidinol-phosphate aminotransferase